MLFGDLLTNQDRQWADPASAWMTRPLRCAPRELSTPTLTAVERPLILPDHDRIPAPADNGSRHNVAGGWLAILSASHGDTVTLAAGYPGSGGLAARAVPAAAH